MYIATGDGPASEEINIGRHRFRTAPGCGWQIRIAVAPFGESRLYRVEEGQVRGFPEGVYPELLEDGETIRVRVKADLLPEPLQTWRYYVLVGAFDGLAVDFWRDLGDGPWQVGGARGGRPFLTYWPPLGGKAKSKKAVGRRRSYPVAAVAAQRLSLLCWQLWGGL